MRTIIVVLALASLAGCAAATEEPSTPAQRETKAATPPTDDPSSPDAPAPDVPTTTQDFPATCVAARFTTPSPTRVKDATTGLEWIGTDIAYFPGQFPTPNAACGFDGGGFRAATSAEVIALATAIPGCTLPGLFAPVYAWAPSAKAAGPLPITTSDGCVDVKAGVEYAGTCHLAVDASRSTLCVK